MAPPLGAGDRLAIVKIETEIPDGIWMFGFTQKHPDLLLEIHNILLVAGGALGDFEITGPPVDWRTEIAEFPDVIEVSRLDSPPDLGRYRVLFRETVLVPLMTDLQMLVRYPSVARDGTLTFETVDRISQIRRLVVALRDAGREVRLLSLRKEPLRSRLVDFTPTQREIFRQALAAGYFEVPRRISLTRLSEELSRSKSSVSEMLAAVEQKLAEAVGRSLA
jgi:predicted DNA binding protein